MVLLSSQLVHLLQVRYSHDGQTFYFWQRPEYLFLTPHPDWFWVTDRYIKLWVYQLIQPNFISISWEIRISFKCQYIRKRVTTIGSNDGNVPWPNCSLFMDKGTQYLMYGRLCTPQADGSDTKVNRKEKATLQVELQLFVVQPNITSPALHILSAW